jgi:lysophospholipase L1-like esterase
MASHRAGVLKVIGVNVLIFFVIANVLYWSIPTIQAISSLLKPREIVSSTRVVYRSFAGWKFTEIKSPSINVEGPYLQRRTMNGNTRGDRKVYFFGGSTVWGLGAEDATTIPSHFAAMTGLASENFGEFGYTAHQGLIVLLQLLQDGHRPDTVVFYDGVNDVWAKCRREHTPQSHMREHEFDALIFGARPDSFAQHFRPLMRLAARINDQTVRALGGNANPYDCDTNPAKADAIAENLVRDWRFARQMLQPYGTKFYAFLQPVVYFSRVSRDGLRLRPYLEQQFEAVYSRVREKIEHDGDIHDLVSALDVDERVYYDFCHINGNGNRYVAAKIAEVVGPAERAAVR